MKKGISASKGYAIGNVVIKEKNELIFVANAISDVEKEKNRLRLAINESKEQLMIIKNKAEKELGVHTAAVFESHIILLDDPEFIEMIYNNIEMKHINSEKALNDTTNSFLTILEAIEDEYLKERAFDIKDVSQRIMGNLLGNKVQDFSLQYKNTVVVAHDLTPSDIAELDKKKTVAFLTDIGGKTSHSAIMARTLEIPSVIGLMDITTTVNNGDLVIVDGEEGLVIVNPDKRTINEYRHKKLLFQKEKENLKKRLTEKTYSKTGKRIEVVGNIGKPEDVLNVIENGGEGVGLFRTEFLYMERNSMPSEEEQFLAYKYVAEKLKNHPLVIRTVDIGGDKNLSYLPMPKEMNPFLGYRAIRISLDREDIFKVQLRAILRASVFGNLKIMFPMISSLGEFFAARELFKECEVELAREGVPYKDDIELGIMIEIPSAAILSDEFAKYVDFFSIGTNDLIQYTLAADRLNENVAKLYNPMHPAVLRLIKMTIDAAHANGKWCGMCGEMAGDEAAIKLLVSYGLDEFSMNAPSIPKAKKIIMESK